MSSNKIIEVKNLSISFNINSSNVRVVESVDFDIKKGKTLALVGESGCGKSVTASALMRLLPFPHANIDSGKVFFKNEDLLKKNIDEMYKVRGGGISMIFQEPMTAMNPVHTSGKQIREVFNLHRDDIPSDEIDNEVIKLLNEVEMQAPDKRIKSYPFQLSGGMRQRMMIAMALAGQPDILIADEPTTALDVTVQAQILKLIKKIQQKRGMGVLFITHDMGVVAEVSDEIAVMYAGQIVEKGDTETIFKNPSHPYTIGLINSIPSLTSRPKSRLSSITGSVPAPVTYTKTCRFAPRCRYAGKKCFSEIPELDQYKTDHYVRCLKTGEIS